MSMRRLWRFNFLDKSWFCLNRKGAALPATNPCWRLNEPAALSDICNKQRSCFNRMVCAPRSHTLPCLRARYVGRERRSLLVWRVVFGAQDAPAVRDRLAEGRPAAQRISAQVELQEEKVRRSCMHIAHLAYHGTVSHLGSPVVLRLLLLHLLLTHGALVPGRWSTIAMSGNAPVPRTFGGSALSADGSTFFVAGGLIADRGLAGSSHGPYPVDFPVNDVFELDVVSRKWRQVRGGAALKHGTDWPRSIPAQRRLAQATSV